ncbi:xanthine dehydrogenase [Candidatus Heimdallarchaeota archaeon B3_Heim]|nr:MAG: xanthine dehydrogenase [Candidatus Heimdallarchaeota archaeon B3_Heim]
MELTIIINKKDYAFSVDPSDSLLSILREHLSLTGTKNGCSQGHCGACTVVVNGKAVKSCITKAKKLENAEVLTIEGVSSNFILHAIQEAFIEATAVQCGFCTPGYIMELYALLQADPDAEKEEIHKALEKHLCRCTGYQPIIDAALLAQEKIKNS